MTTRSTIGRRGFLQSAAAATLAAPALGAAGSDARPNLLIIQTDQQSSWTLGAYGGTLVGTPHIDRIGREGAVLEQFFTNSAVCTPSRGCMITGRYPHSHGAYRNNLELGRDEVTLAELLRRGGYRTGYAGKWHLDGPPKPGWMTAERSMGFTDCRYMFNRGHWKKIVEAPDGTAKVHPYQVIGDEKTFTTDWLADKTIDFIGRNRDKPFCWMVSIPDPHGPFTVREPYDTMYKPDDMPVPSTVNQVGLPWQPAADAAAKRKKAGQPVGREARCRQAKAKYCGLVKCIDDNVGRILGCLKEQGILDETIVVFTTDHGEYMGEHGLYGKNQLYETAYHLPFLVRWPEKIAAGTRIDRIVSTVDVQPTLAGLMGVAPSGREQGHDASPMLCGRKTEWTDASWLHHSSLERAGVFTPEYELALIRGGGHILFDRVNDPEQTRNLYSDPAKKAVADELTARVIAHHREVKSSALEWLET
ncbi:MAG: sulfatase-like hydrolase/transferase [Candidatus Nealsonbacteria bacterium]|nr:sulfatase-like hydrolase/transferase [Candidatus Nealsonbacteria bacterium]